MPSPTPRQAAADKLDNAYADFIRDMGDGSGDAFVAAYDYREAGYAIAEAAMRQAPRNRETFIENECDDHDESARYLVACAADFRLAEIEAEASRQAIIAKTAMTLNFGSGIAA